MKRLMMILCVMVLSSLIGCGGGGDSGGMGGSNLTDGDATGAISSGMGTLSVGLTDATTKEYKAIYVTIKEVRVVSRPIENETGIPS